MMRLKVQTISASANSVRVAWFVGLNRNGVIDVDVGQTANRIAIAELTAVRYLLWDREIFGNKLGSGKGIAIGFPEVTIEIIQNCPSINLRLASLFLQTWLDGALIKSDEITYDVVPIEEPLVIRPYDSPHPIFNTLALGRMAISQHALQRYRERFRHGQTKSPWLSLYRQLMHSELCQARFSERTRFQKLLKYGEDGSQVWHHPTGDLYFQILPQEGYWLVVTVFSSLDHAFAEEVA